MRRWFLLATCAAAVACDPLLPLRVMDEAQPVHEVQLFIESFSEPGQSALRSGAFITVRAEMYDVNGNLIEPEGKAVEWTSATADIVTIDNVFEDPTLVSLTGGKAGSTVVTATVDGKSNTINVSVVPGAPARVVPVGGSGQLGIVSESFLDPFTVEVRDDYGNAVGAGTSVQFLPSSGSILGGSFKTTDAGGQASATWTPTSTGSQTLTARYTTGVQTAITAQVTTLALGITTAPATTTYNGMAMNPAPAVQLRFASNGSPYAKSGKTVTASLTGNTTAMSITGNTAVTNASGVATFSNLIVNGVEGPVMLRFSTSAPAAQVTSTTETLLRGGTATKLAIDTQPPASAVSGRTLSRAPVVQLKDANNNASPQAGVVITATASNATVSGTQATTDVDGRATFSQLAVTGTPGGSYQLTFSAPAAPALGSVTAASAILTGPETALALAQGPTNAMCNETLVVPPAVRLRDAAGRNVSQAGVTVTAALPSTVTNATIHAGSTAVTDADGIARFTGLVMRGTASLQTLNFTAGSLTGTSASINVVAGDPYALAMVQEPGDTVANGAVLSPAPQVRIVDLCGNPVTNSSVSVTVATEEGGVQFQNGTRLTSSGVASFSSLVPAGLVGTYTLVFTADGLFPAVQEDSVTLIRGAAARLRLLAEPSVSAGSTQPFAQQPRVQVEDVGGNPVSAARTVTTAISTQTPANGAVVAGGSVALGASDSVAVFDSLRIKGVAGDYRLVFSSSGLVPDTALLPTTLGGAGTASRLVFDTVPSTGTVSGAVLPQTPVLRLQDETGANVALAGIMVTASVSDPGGSLQGQFVATDSAGTASFSTLKLFATSQYVSSFSFGAPGLDTVSTMTDIVVATLISAGSFYNASGNANVAPYFAVSVPTGYTQLTVETVSGFGDANIYVRRTNVPGRLVGQYDCVSATTGTPTELCSIPNPEAGYWFIQVHGTANFSTSLRVTLTP